MPKKVKVKNTKTPDVIKKKHIVNPYACKWFQSPDKPVDKKRQTAVYSK